MRIFNDEVLIDTDFNANGFTCTATFTVWSIETSLTNWAIKQLNELNYN